MTDQTTDPGPPQEPPLVPEHVQRAQVTADIYQRFMSHNPGADRPPWPDSADVDQGVDAILAQRRADVAAGRPWCRYCGCTQGASCVHGCAWTGPYRCSSCSPDDDDALLTFPTLPGMPAEWPPDDAPWVWPADGGDGSAPGQPGDLPHLRVHVAADDADPDRACPHPDMLVAANVYRLTDDGPTDPAAQPLAYHVDVTVTCTSCGERFVFDGVPVGVSPDHPTCSLDRTELRAPIRPASIDWLADLTDPTQE